MGARATVVLSSPSSPKRATPGTTLRSSGSCVAAPREARRAKRGGARRDRTADLLHAMQALSQLSYGPLVLSSEHGLFGKPVAARVRPEGMLFRIMLSRAPWATRGVQNPDHRSGTISSLLVAADVADDVGDVLVAFLLV